MATAFEHPARGTVHCPAAPLLTAWLEARGVPCGIGTVTVLGDGDSGTAGRQENRPGVLATSYLDPSGRAVGLAAAAPAHLADAARQVVLAFTAVLRTRRVLLPERLAPCAAWTSATPRPRAGSSPSVPARDPFAKATDHAAAPFAACSAGAEARRTADRHLAEGETLLLVGTGTGAYGTGLPRSVLPGHPEELTVGTVEQAERINPPFPERLSFVVTPCTPLQEVREIVALLRRRFSTLRGQHPDQMCYRASDLRDAADTAARQSDLVLLLGTSGPVLPRWLPAGRTVRLDGPAGLRPELLAEVSTLTVLEPAPGPPGALTTAGLLALLGGLGPVGVVDRRVVSEIHSGHSGVLGGMRDAAFPHPL
ncbi:hypothetical protein [Kitasatospora sp. NPDC002040]|uniref:hypothetical protein n=1 Tax=Kitasatospora sp. NPDC002040 TaxID=3154661 RepID=UPI00331873A9